jgi:hypothetical protein
MNEGVLYALAEVAVALAGFSGLVVVFRFQGVRRWSPMELRMLWLLIGDSFLVLLFSLLPVPLSLFGWSASLIWSVCPALLGTWFFLGSGLAIRGDRADRARGISVSVPAFTPILSAVVVGSIVMGAALWLSVFDLGVPRGQGIYVLGLILLVAYAAVEFLFFIGLMSQRNPDS